MALNFLSDIYHDVKDLVVDIREKRSEEQFFLVKCFPWPPLLLFACYFAMSKIGPELMAKRQPFELRRVMIVYNFVQVVINLCLGIVGFHHVFFVRKTKWICEPVDFTESPMARNEFTLGYYYLLLKVFDLLDTVFIILKKNNRQLTFLHIYHHSGMIFAAFVGMFFVPGGTSSWVPLVNVFVHAIMYSYYLLSIIRPEYKKSIQMKKTLTQIQMVQFTFLSIVFMGTALMKDCKYPSIPAAAFGVQCIGMFMMFYEFYRQAYMKRKQKSL